VPDRTRDHVYLPKSKKTDAALSVRRRQALHILMVSFAKSWDYRGPIKASFLLIYYLRCCRELLTKSEKISLNFREMGHEIGSGAMGGWFCAVRSFAFRSPAGATIITGPVNLSSFTTGATYGPPAPAHFTEPGRSLFPAGQRHLSLQDRTTGTSIQFYSSFQAPFPPAIRSRSRSTAYRR
jgi:hypothetical protein